MSEANLNVNGVTPLMHNALIAQYDAIMGAVIKACPVVVHLETYDMYNAILAAIANHDPRKGAI